MRKEKKLLHLSARYGRMFQENILLGHFTKSGETLEIREKFQQLATRPIFRVNFEEFSGRNLFPPFPPPRCIQLVSFIELFTQQSKYKKLVPCVQCPIVVILVFPSLVMRILENYIGITVIGPQESSKGGHQISAFIYIRGYLTFFKRTFSMKQDPIDFLPRWGWM